MEVAAPPDAIVMIIAPAVENLQGDGAMSPTEGDDTVPSLPGVDETSRSLPEIGDTVPKIGGIHVVRGGKVTVLMGFTQTMVIEAEEGAVLVTTVAGVGETVGIVAMRIS